MRRPGAASLRTIPLRRCSPAFDPRVRFVVGQRHPCGFSPWRMRCGCARWRTGRLRLSRGISSRGRDVSPFATQVDLSSVIRAGVDRRNRFVSRSRTTRHIKRYRFDQIVFPRGPLSSNVVLTRSTIPFIRCPSRVMHRRVPWRGVPLPDGPSLRSLAEASWSFPRNLAQRRSWGSLLFAGLLPHAGDRPSLVDRAHLPFSFSLRPIDFRRADFTALSRERMRARSRAANHGFL